MKIYQFSEAVLEDFNALMRLALRAGTLEAHQHLVRFESDLHEVELPEGKILRIADQEVQQDSASEPAADAG